MTQLKRLALLLAIWLGGIASWIAIGPPEDASARADAALVLGAAVYDDEPSPVFRERIRHAIALYKAGRVKRIVFTGGKAEGDSLLEAEAAKRYAIQQGVPEAAILLESQSRTTRQNLAFAKPVLQRAGIDNVLLVSDPLHLRRARQMAQSLDIEAQASATPTTRYRTLRSQIPFLLREVYFMHHFWVFGA